MDTHTLYSLSPVSLFAFLFSYGFCPFLLLSFPLPHSRLSLCFSLIDEVYKRRSDRLRESKRALCCRMTRVTKRWKAEDTKDKRETREKGTRGTRDWKRGKYIEKDATKEEKVRGDSPWKHTHIEVISLSLSLFQVENKESHFFGQ